MFPLNRVCVNDVLSGELAPPGQRVDGGSARWTSSACRETPVSKHLADAFASQGFPAAGRTPGGTPSRNSATPEKLGGPRAAGRSLERAKRQAACPKKGASTETLRRRLDACPRSGAIGYSTSGTWIAEDEHQYGTMNGEFHRINRFVSLAISPMLKMFLSTGLNLVPFVGPPSVDRL